jgi:hypothetical protein
LTSFRPCLASFRIIIESNTNGASMMAIVLPDDLLARQLPQSSVMVRTCRHKVRRIGTKRTVPDPSLMTGQGTLQPEWRFLWCFSIWRGYHLLEVLDFPDFGGVVGTACGEVLHIG